MVSGSGWNLWVWLLGVVVRRYIDFLIQLVPTPLVSVLFCSSIPTFCSFKKMFFYNRTGVNCFWIVDNSQQVLNRICKINYFSPAKHINSFDFSTLYTSIPHDTKIALTSLR